MAFDQGSYDLQAHPLNTGGTYGEGRISDLLGRMRSLQGALQSGDIDYATYRNIYQTLSPNIQSALQIAGGGSNAANAAHNAGDLDLAKLNTVGGQDLNQFSSIFQNMVGRAPNAQDINSYFTNIGSTVGQSGNNYADVQNVLGSYIQNQYGPQIQQYQQQQQSNQLDQAQNRVQNLINQQNQQTVNQLTRPENVEAFKEAFNSSGRLDSGAFSQALGNTLGNAASGNISAGLGSVSLPGISNIMGTSNFPYESFLQNIDKNLQGFGEKQTGLYNFGLQKDLAEQIANMGKPSGLQQWAPILAGGMQAGSNVAAGQLSGRPTYLCTKLKNLGLMTEEEVKKVHDKIFPYAFFHPVDLLLYGFMAPAFIMRADEWDFRWEELKPKLCDEIIDCKTSKEAFQKYRAVCLEIFSIREVCHG